MDFTEVMDINDDGLIQLHCVYWGWFGVRVLPRNEYHCWTGSQVTSSGAGT